MNMRPPQQGHGRMRGSSASGVSSCSQSLLLLRWLQDPHRREFIAAAAYTVLEIMSLDFPNQSRSYDATLRAVRFWGHDGAMEASFFVNEEALKRIQPDMRPDEAGLLSAFDSHRDLIHATASKVYKRGRKGSYELSPDDF